MKVEVRLFAYFREGRGKKIFLDVDENYSVKDVVKDLKIDENEVHLLLVNGRDGYLSTELKDGDTISLFPPVGGG